MNKQGVDLWQQMIKDTSPAGILHTAMQYTRYSLQEMLTQPFQLNTLAHRVYSLDQLATYAQSPEEETVAVYLQISDTLPGQALLMLTMPDALQLVDWLIEEPIDHKAGLNSLMSSALAETGNIMLASFLNALSHITNTSILLSPPAVIVDMLATVLEVVATAVAAAADEITLLEAEFKHEDSNLYIRFWLLPDPDSIY